MLLVYFLRVIVDEFYPVIFLIITFWGFLYIVFIITYFIIIEFVNVVI